MGAPRLGLFLLLTLVTLPTISCEAFSLHQFLQGKWQVAVERTDLKTGELVGDIEAARWEINPANDSLDGRWVFGDDVHEIRIEFSSAKIAQWYQGEYDPLKDEDGDEKGGHGGLPLAFLVSLSNHTTSHFSAHGLWQASPGTGPASLLITSNNAFILSILPYSTPDQRLTLYAVKPLSSPPQSFFSRFGFPLIFAGFFLFSQWLKRRVGPPPAAAPAAPSSSAPPRASSVSPASDGSSAAAKKSE